MQEYLIWKRGGTSRYPSQSEMPLEVAVGMGHLIAVFGRSSGANDPAIYKAFEDNYYQSLLKGF